MLKTNSQSSRTLSQIGTSRPLRLATPALFTRMSTGPAFAMMSRNTRSRSFSFVKSPRSATPPISDATRSAFSAFMSKTPTFAPAEASRRQTAAPIPCPPPVTTATLPSSRKKFVDTRALVVKSFPGMWGRCRPPRADCPGELRTRERGVNDFPSLTPRVRPEWARDALSTPACISHNSGTGGLRTIRNAFGENGMKPHRTGEGERSLAVFIDFENMGLGFNNRRDRFEINKVLERLVEKGKIVAKKAYADWSRFGMYTGGLHEAAIELVEIPRRGVSGKNSADIRLVVDAIDLAYSKDHIDTFVIVSGDSDFSPLVSKLKELGKHVIGLGLVDATSDLLRDNCDEFIYYEDLDRAPIIPVTVNESIPERKRKVFGLLLDTLLALRRENKEIIYSSMVKDTIKRKKPSFNEEYYGYRTFSELLEDAQREGLIEIEKHKTSGMYVVTRFGLEMKSGPVPQQPARVVQLPQRNGGEQKRVELPARIAEPKQIEPPKQ